MYTLCLHNPIQDSLIFYNHYPAFDVSFVSHGTHVFVDPKSLAYLEGLEVDWIRQGLNEGFDFSNPNERDRCGCGESFRV